MRTTVYNLLKGVSVDIPDDRIKQLSSLDETPEKPFIVYRLSGNGTGVTRRSAVKPIRLEVWVHDTPGSYTRIDDVLLATASSHRLSPVRRAACDRDGASVVEVRR